jgi:hypothetical protein
MKYIQISALITYSILVNCLFINAINNSIAIENLKIMYGITLIGAFLITVILNAWSIYTLIDLIKEELIQKTE